MRTRDFIGKKIDVGKVEMLAFASYYERIFDQPVVEIDLDDFDHEADTDKAAFNRYSIRSELIDNRISAIRRIRHCEDNGGDAEAEVLRFPYQNLEAQAQDRLRILVTELSPSSPD